MKRDLTKLLCDVGEMTDLFSDSTSLENFLQRIVELVSEHMHSEVCSIYIYYEDTHELVLKATKGLKQDAIGQVTLKLGEGLTGLAVKELRPVCEQNASASPLYRYFPGIGEETYESFLAVPIVRGQARIGAIVVQNSKKNYFTDDDIRAFRAITSQLANTIETAKLLIGLNEKHQSAEEQLDPVDLKFIKGRVGSEGFAFAPCMVKESGIHALKPLLASCERTFTLKDFNDAVHRTEDQLKEHQAQIENTLADVASLIFSAQILMLKDKPFMDEIIAKINGGANPAEAIVLTVEKFALMFDNLPNQYLREKKHDVLDIGIRLLENLIGIQDQSSDYEGKLIVARELFPSDVLKLSSRGVKGFILLSGGITSHVSILARSLQIPVVISEELQLLRLNNGEPVLIDGEQGNIYINPGNDVIQSFQKREEDRQRLALDKDNIKDVTATKDGARVRLLANINLLSDLKIAREYKAEGVGLYRSEFPFIVRSNFPSEEEQFVIYQKLVDQAPGRELVFRTLDIGGDKVLSYYDYSKEKNPYLGMRSIRFSLKHKDVFSQQVRAILRAGAGSELKIMFPMVSSIDEFVEAKNFVQQSIEELKAENVECHDRPKIGMMVELPAVLEIIDEFAQLVDFLSIGTNDFIQYMLAVDRTNEKVADLYLPHHPAILRALKKVVDAANKYEKDVSMCGDMAQQEQFIPYLIGIGLRKLSVDARSIPRLQRQIESLDVHQTKLFTASLLNSPTIADTGKIFNSK